MKIQARRGGDVGERGAIVKEQDQTGALPEV
jgi:hypothetical protein